MRSKIHQSQIQALAGARVERGAILILVMLVLLVLATVIMQIWFTADVDKQIAVYQKNSFPLKEAAQGSFMNACSILMQDMQEGSAGGGEDGGDLFGGGGDSGGEAGSSGEDASEGNSQGGEDGGDSSTDTGEEEEAGSSMTDSLVDSWAQPGESGLAFTSDVEVQVLIRDEDAKFNILSILSRDEEFQEKSMERLVRVIDLFREETRGDISYGSAREIAEALKDWMHGDRGSDDFPVPFVKTGAKDDNDRDDRDEEEPREYPLTMEELTLCPDITSDILYGYMDGRERIPGLIEYITIYSNLIFDTPKPDEEETSGESIPDPWDNQQDATENDVPDEGSSDTGEGDRTMEDEVATETNNGLINVNTAPLPVLKALMEDSDLPYSVLDELEEYRVKAIEKYRKDMNDSGWDEDEVRFGDTADSKDDKDKDKNDKNGGSAFDEDEDEDFIFKDPYNVITRVEDYFESSFELDEDIKAEFCSLLSVKSNVFTVYVIIKSSDGRNVKNYRAVVWRRTGAGSADSTGMDGDMSSAITGGDSGQIVTLVPLEEYPHPIPFRADELEAMESGYN